MKNTIRIFCLIFLFLAVTKIVYNNLATSASLEGEFPVSFQEKECDCIGTVTIPFSCNTVLRGEYSYDENGNVKSIMYYDKWERIEAERYYRYTENLKVDSFIESGSLFHNLYFTYLDNYGREIIRESHVESSSPHKRYNYDSEKNEFEPTQYTRQHTYNLACDEYGLVLLETDFDGLKTKYERTGQENNKLIYSYKVGLDKKNTIELILDPVTKKSLTGKSTRIICLNRNMYMKMKS